MVKRILIFDDDQDILSVSSLIFIRAGWEVHSRDCCDDVIKDVADIQPSVILMDNLIPQQGGLSATQIIKANEDLKHIPVIYFSASNNIEALAKQAGADSFISKPFNVSDLEAAVNNAIRKDQ